MATEPLEPVQLDGERLGQMRQLVRDAEGSLREIAEIVRHTLRGESSHSRVKHAKFIFDNLRVVIEDGDGCGVYEDPPGVCRPCREGE
jgi:hypothetical protein